MGYTLSETKTEKEIIRNWKYLNPPLVSIICITFNHRNYINDSIKGFLMQETDFPFEIIIHDDASSDGTTDIVRKYESEYPNLIKGIYQLENQYSKGERVSAIAFSKARGVYFAFCEGDDFWIDPFKLQKQVQYLLNNPHIPMCFHRVYQFDQGLGRITGIRPVKKSKSIFTIQDVLEGSFIQGLSVVFKKQYFCDYPSWSKKLIFGDWVRDIELAKHGEIKMFPEIMGVYRKHSMGLTMKLPKINFVLSNISLLKQYEKEFRGCNLSKIIYKNLINNYSMLLRVYKKKNHKKAVRLFLKYCFVDSLFYVGILPTIKSAIKLIF